MMKIDKIIGDVILVTFRDPERLKDVGLNVKTGNFMVNGFDQFGLWLAHPGMFLIEETDKSGKPLPPAKQKREQIEANFLVTWDNIQTMVHFPDREGYDFPDEFDKSMGFEIKGIKNQ